MDHLTFANQLIELLITIEKGRLALDQPLPEEVVIGIKQALVGFGDLVLPHLHQFLEENKTSDFSFHHLPYILGKIGHESSVSILIDMHKNYSGDIDGAANLKALIEIGTEEAYQYTYDLLTQYLAGNLHVFNSEVEIAIACKAMILWQDQRTDNVLKQATQISNHNGMPMVAITALAQKPNGKKILEELAQSNPILYNLIQNIIKSE